MIENEKIRREKIIGTLFFTALFTGLLCGFWNKLELHMYGEIQSRVVDDIILIPMIYSIYLNSKHMIDKLYNK